MTVRRPDGTMNSRTYSRDALSTYLGGNYGNDIPRWANADLAQERARKRAERLVRASQRKSERQAASQRKSERQTRKSGHPTERALTKELKAAEKQHKNAKTKMSDGTLKTRNVGTKGTTPISILTNDRIQIPRSQVAKTQMA